MNTAKIEDFKSTLKVKTCWGCGLVLKIVCRDDIAYIVHPEADCVIFRTMFHMAAGRPLTFKDIEGFRCD